MAPLTTMSSAILPFRKNEGGELREIVVPLPRGPALYSNLPVGLAVCMANSSKLGRITKIALVVNAIAHGTGMVGMVTGLAPLAAGEPFMARRAAAAGLAGIVMMLFVSRNLVRDARLIALPIAFVFCNLVVSVIDLVITRDPQNLPPAVFELVFLAIYSAYALTVTRP